MCKIYNWIYWTENMHWNIKIHAIFPEEWPYHHFPCRSWLLFCFYVLLVPSWCRRCGFALHMAWLFFNCKAGRTVVLHVHIFCMLQFHHWQLTLHNIVNHSWCMQFLVLSPWFPCLFSGDRFSPASSFSCSWFTICFIGFCLNEPTSSVAVVFKRKCWTCIKTYKLFGSTMKKICEYCWPRTLAHINFFHAVQVFK